MKAVLTVIFCVLMILQLVAQSDTQSQTRKPGICQTDKCVFFVVTTLPCGLCFEKPLLAISDLHEDTEIIPVLVSNGEPNISGILIDRESRRTPFAVESFVCVPGGPLKSDIFGLSTAPSPFLVVWNGKKYKTVSYQFINRESTSSKRIRKKVLRYLR
jgi:hypothetical protein